MRFRPCIDIHNGIVKQIVGSSLKDENDQASENYVANRDASWFAKRYKQDRLQGGHVILLNPQSSRIMKRQKSRHLKHCMRMRAGCRLAEVLLQIMHLIFCAQVHLM